MTRPLRIEYEDACYHVMNRGRDKEFVDSNKYYLNDFSTLVINDEFDNEYLLVNYWRGGNSGDTTDMYVNDKNRLVKLASFSNEVTYDKYNGFIYTKFDSNVGAQNLCSYRGNCMVGRTMPPAIYKATNNKVSRLSFLCV